MMIQKNFALLALLLFISTATLLSQKTKTPPTEAERQERKEKRAAVREEMQAHHKTVELPVILSARQELEKKISKSDRQEIQRLREVMKTRPKPVKMAKEERPANREDMRAMRKEAHEARKSWREEHEKDFASLDALSQKYANEIETSTQVIKDAKPQWEAARKAIREKHLGEQEGRRRGHHRHQSEQGGEPAQEKDMDAEMEERPRKKRGHHSGKPGHRHGRKGHHGEDGAGNKHHDKAGKFLLMRPDKLERKERNATRNATELDVDLQVAPNPAKGATFATLNLEEKMSLRLRLIDENGRAVLNLPKQSLEAGENRIPLDLNGLTPGRYTLIAQNKKGRKLTTVVVN